MLKREKVTCYLLPRDRGLCYWIARILNFFSVRAMRKENRIPETLRGIRSAAAPEPAIRSVTFLRTVFFMASQRICMPAQHTPCPFAIAQDQTENQRQYQHRQDSPAQDNEPF